MTPRRIRPKNELLYNEYRSPDKYNYTNGLISNYILPTTGIAASPD